MVATPHRIAIASRGGTVGAAVAYVITLLDIPVEILFVNTVEEEATSQVSDLIDASMNSQATIRSGSMSEAGQCDLVIVIVGDASNADESRAEHLLRNSHLIESTIAQMQPFRQDCVLLIMGHPVDALTDLAHRYSGLPSQQVIGTGTSLSSLRLKNDLSRLLHISTDSIDVSIVGESEAHEVVAWSSATIGSVPITKHSQMTSQRLAAITEAISKRASSILKAQPPVYFGLSRCVVSIVESILGDQGKVYPVSAYHSDYDTYVSWPAILGKKGVRDLVKAQLTDEESTKVEVAISSIKSEVTLAERRLEAQNVSTSID